MSVLPCSCYLDALLLCLPASLALPAVPRFVAVPPSMAVHMANSRAQSMLGRLLPPPLQQELIKITGERCFYPNSELMAKPLVNLTRTQNRTEKAAFLLDVGAISTEAREVITVSAAGQAQAASDRAVNTFPAAATAWLQEVLHQHYEDHDSDLAAVPTCNFTALLDPVQLGGLHHMPKLQLTVAWTYSFPGADLCLAE